MFIIYMYYSCNVCMLHMTFRGQRLILCVLFYPHSFIYLFICWFFVCFEAESLFETGAHWLARMAELWTPGFACLCCCAVVMNVCYSAWLLQGFWAPNLGPYACATSKYPARQLPRSVVVFIYHICSCILLNVSHAVLLSVRWKANMNGMLDL